MLLMFQGTKKEYMRKKAHIYLAKYIADTLDWAPLNEYRKEFYAGSILPDCVPSFITKRHEFNGCFDDTMDLVKKLAACGEDKGAGMRSYAARLGIVTHYLADFFTYPHNTKFPGSMANHCHYEKYLTIELKKYMTTMRAGEITSHLKQMDSVSDIARFVAKAHEKYLDEVLGLDNDLSYIVEVVFEVVCAIIRLYELPQVQAAAA